MHRGQGIELPVAVVIAHPAAGAFFLRREMLYTAMTRATTATVVVGTRAVVARAAATPDTTRRRRPARRAARRLSSRGARSAATAFDSDSPRIRRPWAPAYWIESCPPAAAAFDGSGSRSAPAPADDRRVVVQHLDSSAASKRSRTTPGARRG